MSRLDVHNIQRQTFDPRAFHDLDFSMALSTIDEVKIYGRPLAPYERFAETMLNRLRRILGQPA